MSDTARIRGFMVRGIAVPLPSPHRTASGTLEVAPLVLLDVMTDAGVTGLAYSFAYTPFAMAPLAEMVSAMEGLVVGQPVAPRTVRAMLEARFRLIGTQGLVGMAIAAIDMALWDAAAKIAGLPLVRLLGGEARPILAYDSIGLLSPDETARDVEASLERGFRAFKIRAGHPDPRTDAEALAAVRTVAGPDTWVAIDFNQAYSPAEAARRLRALAEVAPAWVEEPVMAQDFAGHAVVRASTATPVQTGENWWGIADMRASIAAGASDLAMPDAIKIGGVSGFLEAAALAAAEAMPVSSHLYIETSAHLLAVTPTAHMLEWFDIAGPILAEPAQLQDGCVTAPDRHGNGLAWNLAAIERLGG